MSNLEIAYAVYGGAFVLMLACIATGLLLMYLDATRFVRARARSDRRRMKARARRLRAFQTEI